MSFVHRIRRAFRLAILLMFPIAPVAASGFEPDKTVHVGTTRQLLLDDYVIGQINGLQRRWHQPQKHENNPILVGEHPWETGVGMPSALYDEGKIRLWYRTEYRPTPLDFTLTSQDPKERSRQIDRLVKGTVNQIAYAESTDGVKMIKPKLGLIDFRGSKQNNLVWGRMGDWANMVIRFPDEPDPAKRYKCMIWAVKDFGGYYGNIGLYSPDGLRWKMAPRPGSGKLDHAYNYWYDRRNKQFVSLIQFGTRPRTIGRMVSDDFVNWHDRREVLVPDEKDPPGTEFYIPTITMVGDLYICFVHIFHTNAVEDGATSARQHGTIDIQLATSRDGLHWQRAAGRDVFLPLGRKNQFDSHMVYYVGPPVEFGEKTRFYYGGYDGEHGTTQRTSRIGLATMRIDGYASLAPTDEAGQLVTRPFRVEGSRLSINAAAHGGKLAVAVLDADGNPIPGYTLGDVRPLESDRVVHQMTWKANRDLRALKGRVVRLKFHLQNAELYSFLVARAAVR